MPSGSLCSSFPMCVSGKIEILKSKNPVCTALRSTSTLLLALRVRMPSE